MIRPTLYPWVLVLLITGTGWICVFLQGTSVVGGPFLDGVWLSSVYLFSVCRLITLICI